MFIWNMTDPLVVNPEIELPQQDISNNYTTDCTIEYSTGNFTCLAVVFNLQRRLGYHLFHTYIPSALIVVMSWISFWIKPEAIPARVTLGVTSLLTLGMKCTRPLLVVMVVYLIGSFVKNVVLFGSYTKYPVAAISAARVICESDRHMDVIVFGVCVPVADGICGGQQFHGADRNESDERLFGRESTGLWRR